MPPESPIPPAAYAQELSTLRTQIDAVDDKLVALLKERSAIVANVGALKRRTFPGACPIRPGREAEQVRRIVESFRGSQFLPAAAAGLWRTIIMASLHLEGEVKISVHSSSGQREFFWLAREYFGPFTTLIRQPTPKRVLGDVLEGKAAIGVLPPFTGNSPETRWWTDVPRTHAGSPKVFAALPFVHTGRPTPDTPTAVAIGLIEPEETGDDLSYLLIEADEMVSQMKLQAAFASAQLEARWIEVLAPVPGKRHHLVEVRGFITPQSERYQGVVAGLNHSIIATSFLGAVAAPVIING